MIKDQLISSSYLSANSSMPFMCNLTEISILIKGFSIKCPFTCVVALQCCHTSNTWWPAALWGLRFVLSSKAVLDPFHLLLLAWRATRCDMERIKVFNALKVVTVLGDIPSCRKSCESADASPHCECNSWAAAWCRKVCLPLAAQDSIYS